MTKKQIITLPTLGGKAATTCIKTASAPTPADISRRGETSLHHIIWISTLFNRTLHLIYSQLTLTAQTSDLLKPLLALH